MQENTEAGQPPSAAKKHKQLERLAAFEEILLFTRWLQVPLLVGLVVALIVKRLEEARDLTDRLLERHPDRPDVRQLLDKIIRMQRKP